MCVFKWGLTMFRKVSSVLLAVAVISGGLASVPASAATKISNGVPCSKLNQTKTVSGYKYKCAKNPLVKNAKLTWLSSECITAASQWTAAVRAQAQFATGSAAAAENKAKYDAAKAVLDQTTATLESSKKALIDMQTKMNTTTDATERNTLAGKVSALALAVTQLSSANSKLAAKVQSIANAPADLKAAASDAKSSAQLLCTKGF